MSEAAGYFARARFSTSDVPAAERIPYWRDFLGRSILNLEFEPQREAAFFGDKTCLMLPGVAISSGFESPCEARRTPEMLALDGKDDLALVMTSVPLVGRQKDREASADNGGSFVVLCTETGVIDFRAAGPILSVRVPAAVVRPMLSNFDAVWMSPLSASREPLRLLTQYINTLVSDCDHLAPELARTSAAHIQDLVALAVGATRDAVEIASGRGLRVARLQAIRADIAENLTDDVSPGAIAMRQRVTPRYVHKLFEGEGTTLSRYVLGQRLARVHRMLSDSRNAGRTVSDIAYSAGFNDLSTFNREFRRRFGATPSDVRAAARREQ